VKQGDTIRFVLRNRGPSRQDWVLGSEQEVERQAQAGDAAPPVVNRLHVDPGGTEEMVWQFNRSGSFRFGRLAQQQLAQAGTVRVEPVAAK